MPKAKISALGCYTPPRVLTNQDLEKLVDTNDQWIMERTGIRERHIAAPEMATSDMAIEAARCALLQRGIDARELDAIILCTVTPDHLFPSTACLVQNAIGAKGAWGFDLIAACSGFLYGLTTGAHFVMARNAQESAGHRLGHHEPHHRLHRPRHLRPVRRRRRRDADRSRRRGR